MTRPTLLAGRDKKSFPLFTVIATILIAVILALFFFEMWFLERFTPVCVDGNSMLSTLQSGDWLYADAKDTPERGDVVIVDVKEYVNEYGHPLFQSGGQPITFIIKRVIATEGDEIFCENHSVWLKKRGEEAFSRLNEPYAQGKTPDFSMVSLKEGEIFVMGDNREVSYDCTETGPLYFRSVTGVIPDWAIEYKGAITVWESFRNNFRDLF